MIYFAVNVSFVTCALLSVRTSQTYHLNFRFVPFISYGYAFMMSAEMPGDAKKMFDSIEDIIAQADEVDEKYLQVKEEFLVRLHFSAEELLLYPRRRRPRPHRHVKC